MSTETGSTETKTAFCTQCGTEVQHNTSTCQDCEAAQNPSSWWARAVIGFCIVMVAVMAVNAPDDSVIALAVFWSAYLGLPIAIYMDMRHVRETGTWKPTSSLWMVALFVPLFNFLAAFYYLSRKYKAVGTV